MRAVVEEEHEGEQVPQISTRVFVPVLVLRSPQYTFVFLWGGVLEPVRWYSVRVFQSGLFLSCGLFA